MALPSERMFFYRRGAWIFKKILLSIGIHPAIPQAAGECAGGFAGTASSKLKRKD
jgi:hypothetical protein